MSFFVVKFAIRGEEPKLILISEAEHDRWCECEPQEGYGCFSTISSFDLDGTTDECLNKIKQLQEES